MRILDRSPIAATGRSALATHNLLSLSYCHSAGQRFSVINDGHRPGKQGREVVSCEL